jgi:hypothetical protein
MSNWMLRGSVFAAWTFVLRLIQGTLINTWPPQSLLFDVCLGLTSVVAAMAWGVIDGRDDARVQPDPDRRRDLAMVWLLAGLVSGVLSGAVCWLTSLFYDAIYVGGLIEELTTFASFTALLVFVPAMGGVVLGRWLIDRGGAYAPRPGGDEERVDTDVFAAVRSSEVAPPADADESTEPIPRERDAEQP